MPELIVGPVIGLVTHNSARILIETPEEGLVIITLQGPDPSDKHTTKERCIAKKPIVFRFSGLIPETIYTVTVEKYDTVPSSFKTFPVRPTLAHSLTFGVVSCNNYRITKEFVKPETDVWAALARKAQNRQVDLVLHLGDQVYGDDDWSNAQDGKVKLEDIINHCIFALAEKKLERCSTALDFLIFRNEITEMYRQCYRDAWGHRPTRLALANVPNIMIYDDHDMRDDLGDKPEEHDLNSKTRFIVECGRRACFEYQRQLYEDFKLDGDKQVPAIQRENHVHHVLGEYGLLFVDSRGAKVFNRKADDKYPFLTSAQWEDIDRALGPNGCFNECKLLITSTQLPLVFFPQGITEAIAKKADDFEGMWSYKQNSVEQHRILEALLKWKEADSSRNIVVTGGDVHLSGFTQVYKNGRHVFDQIIAGPVSNKTISAIEMAVTDMVKKVGENLGNGWTYKHGDWGNKRNVGLIYTRQAKTRKSHITSFSHIMGDNTKIREVFIKKARRTYYLWILLFILLLIGAGLYYYYFVRIPGSTDPM